MSAQPPKPPTHIDVGPHRYTLTWDRAVVDSLSVERRRAMNAETDPDGLTITLRPDLPPTIAAESVLHETLHAVCAVLGLSDVTGPLGAIDDLEERVVVALAPALLDVFRRNPDLVAYLLA